MTDNKQTPVAERGSTSETKMMDFWSANSKKITTALAVLILIIGGYFAYKNLVSEPKENKANEAIFRAEEYYRMDSVRLALNGDNLNPGFLKIMSKYSGTNAAKLSSFYAGSCYLKLGDFSNAVKYLKDFSTSDKQLQVRTYGLLGDAYSEQGKKEEAVEQYKKAGTYYEKDELFSPEYLFRCGYLYESMGRTKDAIAMYKIIKEKYPTTPRGNEIDKYLARLGEISE